MFQSFIIKIFAKIFLWLGLILRKRCRRYNVSNIRTILVKRTDRIGDAVVTLPLLLELKKYFKITVLTSAYNNDFLKDFVETRVFTDKPVDFIDSIKIIIMSLLRVFNSRTDRKTQYDLFLDLNGVRELDIFLKVRNSNLCKYYAGFNMGIWNLYLDYAHFGYVGLFSRKHALESCKDIITNALGVEIDISDYMDFSEKMIKPKDFNIKENFIFVNIGGVDKFRGLSPRMFADIINGLNFQGRIVVMDELGRPHLEDFKKYIVKKNIIYLNKDYSLWELLYISSRSLVYIGSDSGISNLLQMPINTILFYATGMQGAWRPYSRNSYNRKHKKRIIIEETINSKGLKKMIIFAPVWCRPCFDIGCKNKRCIEELYRAKDDIIKEIENYIRI